MLDRIEGFSTTVSKWFEVVGCAAIIIMMVATCIDVVGAKVFRIPLPGAFDFIVLAQLIATAFSAAMVLILGQHVKVDFFVTRLPKRSRSAAEAVVHMLSCALFALIVWRLSRYGSDLKTAGEASAEIRLALYPFAYMIAFAALAVCLVAAVKFARSLREVFKG
jgi:TRAP-type C4-dicarboxylate transport system permease small subunit